MYWNEIGEEKVGAGGLSERRARFGGSSSERVAGQ
jgi:hypothetical protein